MKTDEQFLLEEKFGGEKSEAFFTACKQLALGEPLAYLIGNTPFLGCTIYLDGRPLIPRVETEWWVEKAIGVIRSLSTSQPTLTGDSEPVQVLDLCAGSGCIGGAVAQAVSAAGVDFAEIDARLLPTIEKNIAKNITDHTRCTVYHSNLFAALPPHQKYHVILSNPPYIDPALNRTDETVKDFEPHLALFGGDKGLDVIEQLITAAPTHLVPGGQLWVEHEPEQSNAIAAIAAKHNFQATTHPDQYDVERYSILMLQ